MAIKRRKRGGHVYLEEYKTTREEGKVVSKFVRYIGREDAKSDTYKPRKKVIDRLDLSRSYRAGDVQLLWSIAEDLGFIQIIDGICCSDSGLNGVSPGKLLTVWAVKRRQRTHAASGGASEALPHEVGARPSRSEPKLNTHALYPSRSELRGITFKSETAATHPAASRRGIRGVAAKR